MTFDDSGLPKYRVSLLEFNAEPAIEMTGSRLKWILEELFEQIAEVAVKPFVLGKTAKGEDYRQLQCCLNVNMNR